MFLTLFYVTFQANVRPYKVKTANTWELFNEVCIMLATYLLAMTTSVDLTPEDKYKVGWAYIFICCLNLIVNFSKLFKKFLYEAIPGLWKQHKSKKEKKFYKKKLDQWIKEKLDFCE